MRILILIVACALISCQASKDVTNNKRLSEIPLLMDQNVQRLLPDTAITALSVGVFYAGEKYSQHYGSLDEGQNNPPTDETIYEIASVSKTMVGILIAQAEADGKLSLEDDIRIHMEGDYPNLAYEDQPIQIKHLLTHTSRLPRFLPESINALFSDINEDLPFKIAAIENQYSRPQFFEDLTTIVIDTIPGTVYSYSNADTELAAHILEQVYQSSFDEILQAHLCNQAGMKNTRVMLSEQQKQNLPNGYGINRIKTPAMTTTLWGGGGGIKSNMPDLLSYIEFQLKEDNPIVAITHQALYEDQLGYFWVLSADSTLGRCISHHGGAFGMQNWLFVYPEAGIGVSVITNQSDLETAGKLRDVLNGIVEDLKALAPKQ